MTININSCNGHLYRYCRSQAPLTAEQARRRASFCFCTTAQFLPNMSVLTKTCSFTNICRIYIYICIFLEQQKRLSYKCESASEFWDRGHQYIRKSRRMQSFRIQLIMYALLLLGWPTILPLLLVPSKSLLRVPSWLAE